MATTYREAGDLIKALVDKVMGQSHPKLREAHVTISTTIASRETKKLGATVALKDRGRAILAKTSITSLPDRARGIADAKLLIDDFGWQRLSNQRREALIDHELEHLDLITVRPTKRNLYASGTKYDDLSRPCLKIRPHDWELAGFQNVAERHGDSSIEAMQFAAFRDEHGQLNMFGPSALQIAERAKNKALDDLTERIDKEFIQPALKTNGKKTRPHAETIDLSNACARRHHKRCRYLNCQCECGHPGRKKVHANA